MIPISGMTLVCALDMFEFSHLAAVIHLPEVKLRDNMGIHKRPNVKKRMEKANFKNFLNKKNFWAM